MEQMLRVGVIANTHGVMGEVKIYPTCDDIKRFSKLKKAYADVKGKLKELNLKSARYHKNMVIVKFDEIQSMDEALLYKGCDLYVDRENAVKLKKGEYFVADMIGIKVFTDEGILLGELSDVLQTGANDVYIVKRDNNKDALIPAIKECVKEIDIENKKMTIHLMEGLLD